MTKRKLTYIAATGVTRQARSKKPKSSLVALKKTDWKGDIVPRSLHRFSAAVTAPGKITKVKARYSATSVVGGTTTGVGGAVYFQLNDLFDYSDYTSVFDQYRIVCAEVEFAPYTNYVALTSSATGRLWTVIDYDDANGLASKAAAQAYNNCVMTMPWEKVKRTLVPHTASAAYSGSFSSYANRVGDWIDFASPAVQYFGVKYWADASSTTTSSWFVEILLYIEFRNIRAT